MPWLVTAHAPIVSTIIFLLAFAWLSLAIGRRILIWLAVPNTGDLAERGVAAAVLGAGAIQFVPFALGVTGLLGATSLRIGCGLLALVALPDAWRVAQRVRAVLQNRPEVPRWVYAFGLALLPVLASAALHALTPTLDADGLGYHLTVPKRWLAQGALAYLPTYPYSNTPMGMEMLFMIGMAFAGDSAAKLIHFELGVVAAIAAYLAGKRLHGRVLGAVAVVCLLCGPTGVGGLIGWAYLEGATAAALVASALAWLIWFRERSTGWLRAAALLAGVGVSLKITAGLFPVGLGALTVLALWDDARAQQRPALPALSPILPLAPFVAGPVLPWMARAAVVTGNPVFPLFAKWIPSRDFSATLSTQFDEYNRYMVWGVAVGADWTLERRKLILASAGAVILLAAVVVYFLQRTWFRRATTIVVASVILIQLAAAGLYVRYWVPLISAVQLPILALAAPLFSLRVAPAGVLLIAAVASLGRAWKNLQNVDFDVSGMVKTALGVDGPREFLRRHMHLFPIYEYANRHLKPNAGIVLVMYCGGFYLDRTTFCGDIVQDSLRYTSWEAFVSDVRRLGITHVIAPRSWAIPGLPAPMEGGNVSMIIREQEHAMVGRLLHRHSRELMSAADQALYEIDLKSLP